MNVLEFDGLRVLFPLSTVKAAEKVESVPSAEEAEKVEAAPNAEKAPAAEEAPAVEEAPAAEKAPEAEEGEKKEEAPKAEEGEAKEEAEMMTEEAMPGDMGAMDGGMALDNGGMGMMEAPKPTVMQSVPALIGISAGVLALGILFGILLAKLKIKKGINLYED